MIKKTKGFTLSEVLIALGTIGVVASLILPQLVTGHKAATAKAQFSTAYALLTKSAADMEVDNNRIGVNDFNNPVLLYNKLKEYNRVVIDCGVGANPKNTSVCPSQSDRTTLDSIQYNDGIVGSFVTNNGMTITVGPPVFPINNAATIQAPLIIVDINGKEHRPNKLGYDLFAFQPTLQGEITPVGSTDSFLFAEEDVSGFCCSQSVNPGCTSANPSLNGVACAIFATSDEEFFKKIYKGF